MPRLPWKDYQSTLSPTWLRTPAGSGWVRASGDLKEAVEERLHDAVRARFPLEATSSVMRLMGAERGIDRSPSDTAATFAARVHGAWETWPWAGTPYGVLQALWDAGYSNAPVLLTAKGQSFKLDANRQVVASQNPGGTLDFDGTGRWNTFIVLFPSVPAQWSGGIPASGGNEAQSMFALLRKWAPAYAAAVKVVIVTSGNIWGYPPTNLWGSPGLTWAPATTVVWTP